METDHPSWAGGGVLSPVHSVVAFLPRACAVLKAGTELKISLVIKQERVHCRKPSGEGARIRPRTRTAAVTGWGGRGSRLPLGGQRTRWVGRRLEGGVCLVNDMVKPVTWAQKNALGFLSPTIQIPPKRVKANY